MTDQSKTSEPATCEDLRSATSLPASEDGHRLLPLPAGAQTDLFGQALAPASRSAAPENKKAGKITVTSGQSGSTSLESVSLQESMENRLRVLFPTDGSIECTLTWKHKATPAGRRFCQLAVSTRPISATDSGLWPTPAASDGERGGKMTDNMTGQSLTQRVNQSSALFPTPNCGDASGSSAPMEKRGASPQLNPEFVYWLMGFPKGWVSSLQRGMLSCRKSRRGSSGRQCDDRDNPPATEKDLQ